MYIHSYIHDKFVFLKHFGREFLHGEPCYRLDVSVYFNLRVKMCVFFCDITLENEFKRCVCFGDDDAITLFRYAV